MTHAGAVQLAESINRYWAELGYDAEAHVVEMRVLDGRATRTNSAWCRTCAMAFRRTGAPGRAGFEAFPASILVRCRLDGGKRPAEPHRHACAADVALPFEGKGPILAHRRIAPIGQRRLRETGTIILARMLPPFGMGVPPSPDFFRLHSKTHRAAYAA